MPQWFGRPNQHPCNETTRRSCWTNTRIQSAPRPNQFQVACFTLSWRMNSSLRAEKNSYQRAEVTDHLFARWVVLTKRNRVRTSQRLPTLTCRRPPMLLVLDQRWHIPIEDNRPIKSAYLNVRAPVLITSWCFRLHANDHAPRSKGIATRRPNSPWCNTQGVWFEICCRLKISLVHGSEMQPHTCLAWGPTSSSPAAPHVGSNLCQLLPTSYRTNTTVS